MTAEAIPQSDKTAHQPQSFYDLFALSSLLSSAVRPPDFRIGAKFFKAAALSRYGKKKLSALKKTLPDVTETDFKQVLFLDRYHRELYFDPEASDLATIKSILSELVKSGTLRYPWMFGATLYRRASDLFPTITDALEPAAVDDLLTGTPQGVFQMRKYVTGPLGILESRQMRDMPPTSNVPLWHCDDAECPGIHNSQLHSYPSGLIKFLKRYS